MRGEASDVEQDDPDSKFGPMQRGDFVKNFVPSVRAEPSLLRAEQAGLLKPGVGRHAADAYRELRRVQHHARLNEEPTQVSPEAVQAERAAIQALWQSVFA